MAHFSVCSKCLVNVATISCMPVEIMMVSIMFENIAF